MLNKSNGSILKTIIKGNIAGCLLFAVFIVVSASAILKLNLDDEWYLTLYVISIVISSVIPSMITVLKLRKKALVHGVAVSVSPAIIAFVSTCIISNSFYLIYLSIPLISVISSALAAITAVNIKPKKRRR